jgi:hypothetical protein
VSGGGWNEFPARALTDEERAALEFLLSIDFPGSDAFRAQARTARADALCDCGCASVRLVIDETAPCAPAGHTYPIVDSTGQPDPDRAPVDLTLFAKDGRLFSLDVTTYDSPPHPPWNPLPSVEKFARPWPHPS